MGNGAGLLAFGAARASDGSHRFVSGRRRGESARRNSVCLCPGPAGDSVWAKGGFIFCCLKRTEIGGPEAIGLSRVSKAMNLVTFSFISISEVLYRNTTMSLQLAPEQYSLYGGC